MKLENKILKLMSNYFKNNLSYPDLYNYFEICDLIAQFTNQLERFDIEIIQAISDNFKTLNKIVGQQILSRNKALDENSPLYILFDKISRLSKQGIRFKDLKLYKKLSYAYLEVSNKQKQCDDGILVDFNYSNIREIDSINKLYSNMEQNELSDIVRKIYNGVMMFTEKSR